MKFSVSPVKIVDYLLKDPGKSKFFLSCGYSVANWPQLQNDIRELAVAHELSMRLRQETAYGKEYEIIGEILTPPGRKIQLKTAWFLDAGETDNVRFITAYPD